MEVDKGATGGDKTEMEDPQIPHGAIEVKI
jgi:hypothetical protein